TSLLWGRNWTEIDLGYQVNSRQEHSNPHAHGKSELDESTLAHGLNLQTLSGNFRRYQQKNRWMGVWGLQVEAQKNTRKGFEFLLPNFRRLATGIYLTEEFSWKNRYTLSGGLRVDYGWTSIEASDELISTEPLERSEEHTSELQSRENLVCRLLLEKKNTPMLLGIALNIDEMDAVQVDERAFKWMRKLLFVAFKSDRVLLGCGEIL